MVGIRSQVKSDEATAQLRTAFLSATISVRFVDLELYDSIRIFPDQCVTLQRIDIAILSAGLVNMSYAILPATKHEITMQANYLSTELLRFCSSISSELGGLPAPPRPVTHRRDVGCCLCKSKLLLVELVSSDEVLVNMANPSMTRGTAFFRDIPTVVLQLAAVVRFLLARTAAVSASIYIDAAMAQGKNFKKRHGALTSDWAIKSWLSTPSL
ncbi:hypothetical protein BGZ57DRAFT_963327 [Hyaloscypha finlandica]|nr:hypothetical protein BGZ57DRAFT_963327 [Hyaloscypha finlandica]